MIFSKLKHGESVEKRAIESYISAKKGSRYLYLIGGTHGDEVEGIYVLKKLFEWLRSENSLQEFPVVILPILNIDGYFAQRRVNSNSVDLNRNYPSRNWTAEFSKPKYNPGPSPMSETENRYLIKLFEKYPPGLVISFHSWKPLLNFDGDALEVANFFHRYNFYPIESNVGYPTPGSLGTYIPEVFGVGVLTYECPRLSSGVNLQDIWKQNEEGLQAFFESELLKKIL